MKSLSPLALAALLCAMAVGATALRATPSWVEFTTVAPIQGDAEKWKRPDFCG